MKRLWLPLLLTLIAIGVRTVNVSSLPKSLNWDEAAFGYNAYSLLMTGKDEYGETMPIQFMSVGDYKCPIYIYLLVPVIKLFGLNEFSIRIVPAVLGGLTVPLLYILIWSLFKKRTAAIAGALFLAIAPWQIQFSRAGADVGVSTFLVILGVTLAARGMMAWGGISLGLAMYAYFGERVFVPLILVLFVWYYRKKSWRMILAAIATGIPLIWVAFTPGHLNKLSNTSLLGYQPDSSYSEKIIDEDGSAFVAKVFHNGLLLKTRMILSRYLNHFSGEFLLAKGLEDGRQRIDGMGMLYRSDLILLIAYGVWLFRQRRWRKTNMLLIFWLLLAPLPAAITRDEVHARRALNMIYPLCVMMGLGWSYLWQEKEKSWPVLGVHLAAVFWSLGFYLYSYTIFTPMSSLVGSAGWQYGYKELVSEVEKYESDVQQIVIDTSYQGPYIFFLFYKKYPPSEYQKQAKLVRADQASLGEGAGFDRYVFRPIYWPDDRGIKNILYAGPPERIPDKDVEDSQAVVKTRIFFPNGFEAWRIVQTNNE